MSVLEAVGWALVHFLWQGALMGAFAAIALAGLRRASASVRYAVAAGALVAMAALPAATAWRHLRTSTHPIVVAATAAPSPAVLASARAGVAVRPSPAAPRRGDVQRRATDPPSTTRVDALLPWLVGTWALGVTLLSVRLLGGWLRARRLGATGLSPVPDAVQAALVRLSARLEVRRAVRVFESCLVEVPVAIGWLRPVVLLPASAFSGLTFEQLDAILAHELAHVRRHDYAVNLAQSVIETVLFYHPAVWWVSRQVRLERELCCDDLAVAACGDRAQYARALVGMERLRQPVPVVAVRADGGSLVMRVRRLLSTEMSHAEPAPRWAASVIALMTALTVGVAAGVPGVVPSPAQVADQAHKASPAATPPRPPTIVRSADAATPFASRWAAAEGDARSRGWSAYWIGYSVQPPSGLRGFLYSDRGATVFGSGFHMSGTFSGQFDDMRFPGVSIAPLVGASEPDRIKLLFSFSGGTRPTLTRTHASSLALPVDLSGRPLFWLGDADTSQSLPVVARLFASQSDPTTKSDLVTALGLHEDSSQVVPELVRILTGSTSTDVRSEAAERLGWHSTPASLAALERAARTDRAEDVRKDAVEAIGDLHMAEATPALIALAQTLDDREVRREAVETLGQRSEPAAREALVAIARTDRDVDVQREAVETLGELAAPEAHAALVDIARAHPNVDVRREAIETLGHTGRGDDVVELLARVVREDTSADVQREAVETLGEIANGRGLTAVVKFALDHPLADVRREAIETLVDHAPQKTAIEILGQIIAADRDADIRNEALEGLSELPGGAGIPTLIDVARTNPDKGVRSEALKRLVESDDPRARAVFDRALARP
jgi:beta-lactamase regulating signal transducer with metallopeptidase domain/HEAT repeat protein